MSKLKKPLKVGVLTSLLLTPAALANVQEAQAQTQTVAQAEQVAYVNAVATTETRNKTIEQFGKLSETSTANEMVIADGDVKVLSTTDFNDNERAFIQAKYEYVVAQRGSSKN